MQETKKLSLLTEMELYDHTYIWNLKVNEIQKIFNTV